MSDFLEEDMVEVIGIKRDVSYSDGTIVEVISDFHFNVQLDNGKTIEATVGGKLRQNRIMLHENDRVQVQVISPSDRGRIVERYR